MGLDELHLRVLSISSENPKEKANAQKGTIIYDELSALIPIFAFALVLNLLQKGRHWVLVVRPVS